MSIPSIAINAAARYCTVEVENLMISIERWGVADASTLGRTRCATSELTGSLWSTPRMVWRRSGRQARPHSSGALVDRLESLPQCVEMLVELYHDGSPLSNGTPHALH
jgi:hypothetical protein